jgi:hypothetical protein
MGIINLKKIVMKNLLSLFVVSLIAWPTLAQRKIITEQDTRTETTSFSYPPAQKKEIYNIAVLSPMFLDSVDLEKNLTRIPKFMMPGIDFYQGVRIAADTLKNAGFKLNLFIYDSKSNYLDIQSLIESDKLDSMDCIIGNAGVSPLPMRTRNLIHTLLFCNPGWFPISRNCTNISMFITRKTMSYLFIATKPPKKMH